MRKQWTDVAVAAKAFEELRILFFAGEVLAEITFHFIEERRRAASEQAKQNGVHKKVADLP